MNKDYENSNQWASDSSQDPNQAWNAPSDMHEPVLGAEESSRSSLQKATFLLFLACAMGVGAMFLFGKVKKPAPPKKETQEMEERVDQALQKLVGNDQKDKVVEMFKNTEDMVKVFYDYPSNQQVGVDDLKRNPFERERADVKSNDTGSNDAALAKLREELNGKMAALRLQSILHQTKGNSRCLINGQIYSEGQKIDSFEVQKITEDRVILIAENMEFVLQM